jgi:uncharacterized protein
MRRLRPGIPFDAHSPPARRHQRSLLAPVSRDHRAVAGPGADARRRLTGEDCATMDPKGDGCSVATAPSPRRGGDARGRERSAELLRALADPATYRSSQPVRRFDTHASWVFVSGRWAYKVKKPVRLPFLDYSTLERRHAACREEVRVNRELAGDIYRGVRAIVRRDGGLRLADEHCAGAVEYAVAMRRFDYAKTLAGAISARTLDDRQLRSVARALARFHARAPTVAGGGPRAALRAWRSNLDQLQRLVDPAAWRLELARDFGEAFVRAHAQEMRRRAREGLVRDGHGDLRCEHVLLGRRVRFVDRIEFDPALRRIDVGWDLAFLAMDLQARRRPGAARRLLDHYRRAGGRPGSEALLWFYAAHWAFVRAKVAAVAAAASAAQRLRDLAERLCWQARGPVVIVLAGPAASGKSTLARELASRSGLAIVSSDATRKRLAGLAASERARPEHYASSFTQATYSALARAARARLVRGRGVLLDATFRTAEQRATLLDALTGAQASMLFVRCHVDLQTALARAAARSEQQLRVSDATPAVVAEQFGQFEPPSELAPERVLALDCERPLERQADAVARALDRAAPRAGVRSFPRRSSADC